MAVPFISQVSGQVVGHVAAKVPVSGPVHSPILMNAPVTSHIIPSVQGLIIGQGLSSNQTPIRSQIFPTHRILVKGRVKPSGSVLVKGQIGPSGQVNPDNYVPGLKQVPASAKGLVTGQVMAHEFNLVAVLPGSQSSVALLPEPESSFALLPEADSLLSVIPGSQSEGTLQGLEFCRV
jgi:hypothetical protein